MGRQRQGSHFHVKEREISKETNPADTLLLEFYPPELQENKFLLLSHPVYGTSLWQT